MSAGSTRCASGGRSLPSERCTSWTTATGCPNLFRILYIQCMQAEFAHTSAYQASYESRMQATNSCYALFGRNNRPPGLSRSPIAAPTRKNQRRRVWDLVTFGHDLQMLEFHMRQLESAVDGFLVSESTVCFQMRKTKPALLRDAIVAGSFPSSLVNMTRVSVVTAVTAKAVCGTGQERRFSNRCLQQLQRFRGLEMLLEVARGDDLALVSDVDEIVRPSLIERMRQCIPCPPLARRRANISRPWECSTWSAGNGLTTVLQRDFRTGLHCDGGADSWSAVKLHCANWLISEKAEGRLTQRSFDQLRITGTKCPRIANGGWHLSSFGSTSDFVLKLRTFGAANRFDEQRFPSIFNESRLQACSYNCVDIIQPSPISSAKRFAPVPCDAEISPEVIEANRNARISVNRIDAWTGGTYNRFAERRWTLEAPPLGGADIPPYLRSHLEDFRSWWSAAYDKRGFETLDEAVLAVKRRRGEDKPNSLASPTVRAGGRVRRAKSLSGARSVAEIERLGMRR